MIIKTKSGRKKSVRVESEIDQQISQTFDGMSDYERALVYDMLFQGNDAIAEHHNELVSHRYHTKPVSMEQFIEDPYYLGESCETIWPELKEDLIELFKSPYREFVTTGAIGVGKTFAASIAIIRIIYELSCLVNPQKTFGLSSGTELVIPLISKNLILAREIMKSAVDAKVKESPYFMKLFKPNIKKEYTIFPNNIRVTVGSYGSERVLGANVISAFMDETNFPPKTKRQQIATGFGKKITAAHFDIVEKVYRGLVRRLRSRFLNSGGDFPGMVVLASSAATLDSFTERKLREAREDPDIFVRDHTPWTARPIDNFSGDWFYVLCSTSSLKARILEEEEYEAITDKFLEENDAWIMEVPLEYLDDFETDMENALRDIGGISTQAISSFIQRVDAVDDCVDRREHPFTTYEWTAGGPGMFNWDEMCQSYERTLKGGFTEIAFAPKVNPKALRWCHVDTSISGDSSGLCVAHVDKWVEVVRRDNEGNRHVDVAPYYLVDVMLKINPPPAEQIYMPDIRQLIYQLLEHGYELIGFSTDAYMYVEMHQQVRRRGVHCELISMDRTTEPYEELKSAIYENRIRYYEYEPFLAELKALEYDRLVGKIDHPTAGSKDCSDAVAGCIHGLKKGVMRLPLEASAVTNRAMRYEHSWVSGKIPADQVDLETVRAMKEDDSEIEYMPILFGNGEGDDFGDF